MAPDSALKPTFVLVGFKDAVDLVSRESLGTLRPLIPSTVQSIKQEMEFSFSNQKFGKPTINFRLPLTKEVEKLLFGQVGATRDFSVFNESTEVVNYADIPLLNIKDPDILAALDYIDGRHRTVAADNSYPHLRNSSIYVLCNFENIGSYDEMKRHGYVLSKELVFVDNCVVDIFAGYASSVSTEDACRSWKMRYGIARERTLLNLSKLRDHLFDSSKDRMSLNRDSKLFSLQVFSKRCCSEFVTVMKESGRNVSRRLKGARFEFGTCFLDDANTVKEHLQNIIIQVAVVLANQLENASPSTVLHNVGAASYKAFTEKKHIRIGKEDIAQFVLRLCRFAASRVHLPLDKARDLAAEAVDRCHYQSEVKDLIRLGIDAAPAATGQADAVPAEAGSAHTHQNAVLADSAQADGQTDASPSDTTPPTPPDTIPQTDTAPVGNGQRNAVPVHPLQAYATQADDLPASSTRGLGSVTSATASRRSEAASEDHDYEKVQKLDLPASSTQGLGSVTSATASGRSEAASEDHDYEKAQKLERQKNLAAGRRSADCGQRRKSLRLEASDPGRRKRFRDVNDLEGDEDQPRLKLPRRSRASKTVKCPKSLQLTQSMKAQCAFKCLRIANQELKNVIFRKIIFKAEKGCRIEQLQPAVPKGENVLVVVEATFPERIEELISELKEANLNVTALLIVLTGTDHVPESDVYRRFNMHLALEISVEIEESSLFRKELLYVPRDCEWNLWKKARITVANHHHLDLDARHGYHFTLSQFLRFWKKQITFIDVTDKGSATLYAFWLQQSQRNSFIRLCAKSEENANINMYLRVLRKKIMEDFCRCKGHELISQKNESDLNYSLEPNYDPHDPDSMPFSLQVGGSQDKILNPRVFSHTSLLIRKNIKGRSPSFVDDMKSMCTKRCTEDGYRLHQGVFMKKSEYIRLKKTGKKATLLYPTSILIDYKTKVRKYGNALSPFEMRDLYAAGITHRKLYLFFNDQSIASFFNEDKEHEEILFYPSYQEQQYLQRLYSEGMKSISKPEMAMIRVDLDCGARTLPGKNNVFCSHCKSVELFTYYGTEYNHSY